MHVVLPFCGRDIHLALKGLAICKKLDGRQSKHSLILVWDQRVDPEPVKRAASEAFERVMLWPTQLSPYGFEGFAPANWAWQCTARRAIQNAIGPWLWWEPDAVPLKAGWLDQLEAAYREAGKPLGGWVQDSKWGRYMVGVGIYPQDIIARAGTARMCSTAPWDIQLGAIDGFARLTADLGRLLVHHYRAAGDGDHFDSLEDVAALANGAVLFHRCDDGSLHRLVLGEASEWPRPWFEHSGDLGDIIYALPTIKALGGGTLLLTPYPERPPYRCREQMYEHRANLIIPLLAKQPYIKHVQFQRERLKIDYNLNEFRHFLAGDNFSKYRHDTLASLPLRWFKLPIELQDEKWLTVEPVKPERPVVVARSQRYHGTFDWNRIADVYRGQMVFVGTQDEHTRFCDEVAEVPWHPTKNLLEVAQLIAGSDLFIGNQSSPFAIAEGLKHPAILEWNKDSDNCHYQRSTLVYGVDSTTRLPSVGTTTIAKKPTLNWCSLWDAFSGLGKTSIQFVRRVKSIDLRVVPVRLPDREIEACPRDIPTYLNRGTGPSLVYEAMIGLHDTVKPGDLVLTMWESSKVPEREVAILNTARAVIVPTAWCACNFAASGVKVPLEVVPLGIDPVKYRPAPAKKKDNILRFGMAARFCGDGNPRKQIGIVLDCFKRAFPTEQDVHLFVKGYDAEVWQSDDPRITVCCEYWPEQRLVEWYQGLDCFINMAAGGGWELHLQEAMACGAVPIAMHHSSSMEFFSPENGYPVKFDLVVPTWGPYAGEGLWAQPKPSSIVAALQEAKRWPKALAAKRKLAIEAANRFTWDQSTRVLESVLAKYL